METLFCNFINFEITYNCNYTLFGLNTKLVMVIIVIIEKYNINKSEKLAIQNVDSFRPINSKIFFEKEISTEA